MPSSDIGDPETKLDCGSSSEKRVNQRYQTMAKMAYAKSVKPASVGANAAVRNVAKAWGYTLGVSKGVQEQGDLSAGRLGA